MSQSALRRDGGGDGGGVIGVPGGADGVDGADGKNLLYRYEKVETLSWMMELQVPVPFFTPRISEITNIDTEITLAAIDRFMSDDIF
jgi:hypothetical protein